MNLRDLADSYFRAIIRAEMPDDAKFEAMTQVDKLISDDPQLALELIRELLARCHSETECMEVGAGPLESLMVARAGAIRSELREEALINAKFRVALRNVWAFDSPEVEQMVDSLLQLGD